MNISRAINSQLSSMGSKSQGSKHAGQKHNQRYGDHLEAYETGGGRGSMWGEMQEFSSTNW